MFRYNNVVVTGNTQYTPSANYVPISATSVVTGNLSAGISGAGTGSSGGGNFSSGGVFLGGVDLSFPLLQDILNTNDITTLDATYREIYMMDSVAGPVVDMLSMLPWSDYTLSGITDSRVKYLYESSLEELSIQRLMKLFMASNYVFGRGIGSLVFNKDRGIFTDCVLYNASEAQVIPIPFIGYDPKINIKLSPDFKKWLNSDDKRDLEAKKELSREDLDAMKVSGYIELEPLKTIYVQRNNLPGSVAISAFSRLLPIWLLEKCLLRGTILSSTRRQKSILHITMGDQDMEYEQAQFQAVAEMFANADRDPLGAAVVTRSDIQVSEVRSPTDLWSHSSEESNFTQAKLRALGVSDSFMSADATYTNQENTINLMMENLGDQRRELTQAIIRDKIFLSLAKYHNIRKRTQAELDHRIRLGSSSNHAKKDPMYATLSASRNMADMATYDIPTLKWVKELKPIGSNTELQLMKDLNDAGVPVTASMLAAAAGVDLESVMSTYKNDIEIRKRMAEYSKEVSKFAPKQDEGGGGSFRFGGSAQIPDNIEPIALKGKVAVDTMASAILGRSIELKPSQAKAVESYVKALIKRR